MNKTISTGLAITIIVIISIFASIVILFSLCRLYTHKIGLGGITKTEIIKTEKSSDASSPNCSGYKKSRIHLGPLMEAEFEVPINWNVFYGRNVTESISENGQEVEQVGSVSIDGIDFGDAHGGQIDFYTSDKDLVQKAITSHKKQDQGVQSGNTKIGIYNATSLVYPPSDSIGAESIYYIKIDSKNWVKTIEILMQNGRGREDYSIIQNGLHHILDTFKVICQTVSGENVTEKECGK